MPRPPRRQESIRAEARRRGVSVYQVRVDRGRAAEVTTRRTAVGHGPIPVRIARGLHRIEQGHPRALPIKTLERYRAGIAEYEMAQSGKLTTATRRPRRRTFGSEAAARAYVEDERLTDVVDAYGQIRQLGSGRWEVVILR